MKIININDVIFQGHFDNQLKAGLSKGNIENLPSKTFIFSHEFGDGTCYYFDCQNDIELTILFNNQNIAFEIKLDIDDNWYHKKAISFIYDDKIIKLKEISFDELVEFFDKMNIKWTFDKSKIYHQTICMKLSNDLRLLYCFGDKKNNDYGLSKIISTISM